MTPTQAVERLVRASVGLSDADLDRPFAWHEYDEEGLRFALLVAHHQLRETTATVAAARLGAGRPYTEALRILAQFHESYRDLTGALAGTGEDELDAVPSAGQWPIREVLRHVLEAERGFQTSMETALEARRAGRDQVRPDREAFMARRGAAEDPSGSRADALNALYRSHVAVLGGLADVTDPELDTPSYFWETEAFPIRFRMHRLEEHLRQHTIQVDKTLVAIGHPPTEAERLVRNIYTGLAALESVTSGVDVRGDLVTQCAAAVSDLAQQLEDAMR